MFFRFGSSVAAKTVRRWHVRRTLRLDLASQFRTSATGQPICDAAVTATDGWRSEQLFGAACSFSGAYERPGTYMILAAREGFRPADVGPVRVVMGSGECPHVEQTTGYGSADARGIGPEAGKGATARPNKGMKLTRPERIGALQLIPGVRRTRLTEGARDSRCRTGRSWAT